MGNEDKDLTQRALYNSTSSRLDRFNRNRDRATGLEGKEVSDGAQAIRQKLQEDDLRRDAYEKKNYVFYARPTGTKDVFIITSSEASLVIELCGRMRELYQIERSPMMHGQLCTFAFRVDSAFKAECLKDFNVEMSAGFTEENGLPLY